MSKKVYARRSLYTVWRLSGQSQLASYPNETLSRESRRKLAHTNMLRNVRKTIKITWPPPKHALSPPRRSGTRRAGRIRHPGARVCGHVPLPVVLPPCAGAARMQVRDRGISVGVIGNNGSFGIVVGGSVGVGDVGVVGGGGLAGGNQNWGRGARRRCCLFERRHFVVRGKHAVIVGLLVRVAGQQCISPRDRWAEKEKNICVRALLFHGVDVPEILAEQVVAGVHVVVIVHRRVPDTGDHGHGLVALMEETPVLLEHLLLISAAASVSYAPPQKNKAHGGRPEIICRYPKLVAKLAGENFWVYTQPQSAEILVISPACGQI
ncbi:hypothetical protein C8R47DRAFT_1071648 [Mycena vitilis]|nr:hypothetical protein C8R47DRAFT_1071648 [Mycena vitilis]